MVSNIISYSSITALCIKKSFNAHKKKMFGKFSHITVGRFSKASVLGPVCFYMCKAGQPITQWLSLQPIQHSNNGRLKLQQYVI